MPILFFQATGEIGILTELATGEIGILTELAKGYSGHGEGKNNPAMEQVKDKGPLPRKTPVIQLTPCEGTEMFGRAGMLVHGDSISKPGEASLGCIVEDHNDRVAMARLIDGEGDNIFRVL